MTNKCIDIVAETRIILNLLSDPAVIVDKNGLLMMVNDAFGKETGLKPKELIEKSFFNVNILPAESKTVLLQNLGKRLQGGSVAPYEVHFTNVYGKKRFVEVKGNRINYAGQHADLVVFHDVTRRNEDAKKLEEYAKRMEALVEEKYRDFANSLPEMVFEIRENGQLIFANRRAIEFLGYSKEQMYCMSFFQFIAPEDRPKARRSFHDRFEEKNSFGEYSLVGNDGSRFPVMIFSKRVNAQSGQPLIRGIALDLSELKLAEKKLRIMNEKLQVVGSLTRHDVRNKLTVIRGRAHLLEMKVGNNPELRRNFEEIDKAIDQCDRIFEFSRLYEKIGAEEPKEVVVGDCFSEAIALLPNLGAIKIVNKCQRLKIVADSMLRQLFYNLLENSLRHGKTVTQIRLRYTKDRKKTELVYEDNGVGIPKKDKGRLFAESFTTDNGSGLGLKLVKRMIEAYGWTIKETGVPSKGAKFTITIPKQ